MTVRRERSAGEPDLREVRVRSSPDRLSDRVARELEQRILIGEFAPGDYLPTEAELGELFGVSRSVIRDATRTLAARDLVAPRAGLGNRVLPPNDTALSRAMLSRLSRSELTLQEVMKGRALLEELIIPAGATNSSAEQRAEVRSAFDRFADAVAEGDWETAHSADLAFHEALLRTANDPALDIILIPMRMVTFVCAGAAHAESAEAWNVVGHGAITEALEAQDEPALREAIHRHFDYIESDEYSEYARILFRDAPNVRGLLSGEEPGPS